MVEQKIKEFTDSILLTQDWNEKSLDEISIIDPENLPSNTPNEYFFNYIAIDDIEKGFLKKSSLIKFKNAPSRARKKIQFNDILLSTVRPNLQSHFLMDRHDADFVCSTGFSVIRCHDNIDPKFVYYHLFFQIINKQIQSIITGSNYPAINSNHVKKLKIIIPKSKKEQEKISKSLSEIDELIDSLESLIQKKKNIKQGAMQELLTGKRRLEGFRGEWNSKDLNKICWFQEGPGLRNWQFTREGMKVINVTNLENGFLNLSRTERHISIDEFQNNYKHFEIDEKDIVVASSGNSYGKVAIVRKQDLPLMMNTSVIRFKPSKDLDYNFLIQFLNSSEFKDQIDFLITGGAQPNFGPAHLKKIHISIPPTINEQSIIGKILFDMDYEIYQIENQLDKYKNLKQAMMQKLLTGEIRLV